MSSVETPALAAMAAAHATRDRTFADRYRSTEIGNRGGIVLPGVAMNAPLEAC